VAFAENQIKTLKSIQDPQQKERTKSKKKPKVGWQPRKIVCSISEGKSGVSQKEDSNQESRKRKAHSGGPTSTSHQKFWMVKKTADLSEHMESTGKTALHNSQRGAPPTDLEK